jgi:trans-aconitate 2-methyltransferase
LKSFRLFIEHAGRMKRYQWDAKDYAIHSSSQKDWGQELISKLDLGGDEHLLDIGCGDGKLAADIASQLPEGKVVGIDNSLSMIGLARQKYASRKYRNLSFQLGDARKLAFEDQFDVVFSNAALHWILDHKPVLQGIFRSLKTNGRILLQMGGRGNAASVFVILNELISRAKWKVYYENFNFPYAFYDPDTYRQLLDDCGFITKRVELIPKDMVHQTPVALGAWIRTTWLPYTERLPRNLRKIFIKELTDGHIQKQISNKGENAIHVLMMRLEVEAFKRI